MWRGDSIVGASWGQGQIVVFDAGGNHGRTTFLGEGYYSFAGLMRDGTILGKPSLLIGMPFGTGESSLHRQEARFALITPGGDVHASLGTHAGDEWFFSPTVPGARPHPFGRSVLTTVWSALAVVATNDRYEIRAYDLDGKLARIVRRDHELRAPTQAELDAALAAEYADRSAEDRARLLSQNEGMALVESYPAFSALQSDPLGYLWVRGVRPCPARTAVSGPYSTRRAAFGGSWRCRPGSSPTRSAKTTSWGVSLDELGVERVQLWPLSRGESP